MQSWVGNKVEFLKGKDMNNILHTTVEIVILSTLKARNLQSGQKSCVLCSLLTQALKTEL